LNPDCPDADFSFPNHIQSKKTIMKKICYLIALLYAMSLSSCQKDGPAPGNTGKLLLDIKSELQIREVGRHLKSAPELKDFKVTIFHSDGIEAMVFDSTMQRPDTIELQVGDYYVEAHSNNNLPAAFDNPYYSGISELFSIGPNDLQSIAVNCLLANTMVSVLYSQQVIEGFTEYETIVASELDSLIYRSDESRMGYFRTLPLSIIVNLSYHKPDGSIVDRQLSGSIPFPLANRHYEIIVDASIAQGLAAFQIIMDSTDVPKEVIEIIDGPGNPVEGAYAYGDLLISEIMYDPSSLSDTEGEWFEVYNNSHQIISLQNLVLGRDDANRHTITDPIDLHPGDYLVLERNEAATSASSSYLYGSDILLPNTGALLSIFNEGTESNPGSLIFSVNYGDINFPDGSGSSIALSPERMNTAEAVLGSSWCLSSSAFSSGDLGTPGGINDSCQ